MEEMPGGGKKLVGTADNAFNRERAAVKAHAAATAGKFKSFEVETQIEMQQKQEIGEDIEELGRRKHIIAPSVVRNGWKLEQSAKYVEERGRNQRGKPKKYCR